MTSENKVEGKKKFAVNEILPRELQLCFAYSTTGEKLEPLMCGKLQKPRCFKT